MIKYTWLLSFLLIISLSLESSAQEQEDKNDDDDLTESILDFFEFPLNSKAVARDSSIYLNKLVLAPIISYEPATSLGGGVGAKILFKPKGAGADTRTSNIPISARYTLNNQIILYSGYTVFFNHEKWYLEGNLLYSKFPQNYYGIGSETLKEDEEIFSYTNFLIEPILLRRVRQYFFLGGGVRYNVVTDVELEEDGALILERPEGYDGSVSEGFEVVANWDSRNNVLNATKGSKAELKQGFYGTVGAGTHEFLFTQIDLRKYVKVWRNRPDVIAGHIFGRFVSGDVPIGELSVLGGAESARGYREGRYRDLNVIATQLEYRWQAFERVGFVGFVEAGEVYGRFNDVGWDNIKYSTGAGIRFKIVKSENLNLRLDYGIGIGHEASSGFYLNIAEAF